jgi:CBS domain containing-hemolysin-like protein
MEIAFISANRLRIELDKKQGYFSSHIVEIFTRNPTQYIATLLIGNNTVLVIYGILMAKQLQPCVLRITNNDFYVLIIQTFISAITILVTAEFIPKAIFRLIPNIVLNLFSIPAFIFYITFYPLSRLVMSISYFFLKKTTKTENVNQQNMYIFGKIDLDHLVHEIGNNQKNNEADNNEIKIFRNALDFSKVRLRDCMVPRIEIVAIDENCTINELRHKFIETGFSKILVYNDSIDNITGYINSKELFKNPRKFKSKIIRVPIFPETMNANKLLKILLQERKSLAVVVDEFGGTSGMVTIEDIIEEIFGEIEDEHDTSEMVEKPLSENSYVFSGRLSIDNLNKKYNFKLPESNEYETLAGFILHHLGHIPELNEKFTFGNFSFKIMHTTNKRIDLVYLKYD